MRSGFTLVELLVVLAIMTIVMGVVVPQGINMLNSYEHSIQKSEKKYRLLNMKAESFLHLQEYNITIDGKFYQTTIKGVANEISNDYR